MSGAALALMIASLVLIWGGLIVTVVHLVRHPEPPET